MLSFRIQKAFSDDTYEQKVVHIDIISNSVYNNSEKDRKNGDIMSCNTEREYIYIVLSSTPYRTGKVIRAFKKVKYNHASLSLSPDLEPMYSFSRRHKHSTFNAGFVEESLMRYKHNNNDSDIMVAALPISCEQYEKAQKMLESLKSNADEYIYNYFSAAATAVYGGYVEVDRAYTCIEFVCYFLSEIGVYRSKNPIPSLNAFERVLRKYIIYEGKAGRFRRSDSWGGDKFNLYQPKAEYISDCVGIMRSLTSRYRQKKKK